ncbi:hypothetical protein BDN67DRAFT_386320 [Paxillus ammoniavirescens]|nr:hypothetical protein BDN67DRAFT_386320 [Paxillus ammoniavirescens]
MLQSRNWLTKPGSSKDSTEDLRQLATLTFDPLLNPAFYAVLNRYYVPHVIHSGVVIMLAKWSVMGFLGIYFWIDMTSKTDYFDRFNDAFATNQTHILKWVQFFNRNFLAQETCLQHHIDGLAIDTGDVFKFLVHVLMAAAVRFPSDELLPDLRSEQGVAQAISQLWHPAVSRDDVSLQPDQISTRRPNLRPPPYQSS